LTPGDELYDPKTGLINLPPTSAQKQAALTVVAFLIVALAVVAPFAATPLTPFGAFIPFLNAAILVADSITALLLFVQFSIYRSSALLVLAGAYLFTALIVIPHALTFPGAFSPTGLLGAGLQTTAWLYIFWHFGFPAALLAYTIIIGLVGGIVWLTTAGNSFLPRLFLGQTKLSTLGHYGPAFDLFICAVALAVLWARRRSVLDLWLMVVACAWIGELALTLIRFSVGFYTSRVFSLVTSMIVLLVLLRETARLYERLAHSNMALQRERDNKLMNLEAVIASISHEVRQPLAAMVGGSTLALHFLDRAPPNIEKARAALGDIVADGDRVSQVLNNIRDLFRAADKHRVPIDVNALTSGALKLLNGDLKEHGIATRTELMAEPPLVMGHGGQLEEVLLNLIRNAIEAMDAIDKKNRMLRVSTKMHDRDAVTIAVQDTGPGIEPDRLEKIFDAFVTTKEHGTGLGLAICRMIVESHGGHLSASSPDKGGAVFEMVLPLNSPAGFLAT
jgi:signal transduction histidine kinase